MTLNPHSDLPFAEQKEPPAYQGWKRNKRSYSSWQKVEGATGQTKGDAYERLMQLTELSRQEGNFDYCIMRGAEHPSDQTYHDRMMRPAR